jgi:hypothetical protein
MTVEELSNQFDVLVSSYRRFKNFDNREILDSVEFNEYEKSYFLTKAQNDIVISLYNGRNSSGESFESTEELRRYLSKLVKEAKLSPITNTSGMILGINSNSKFFTLPKDVWYITYEAACLSDAKCSSYNTVDVTPVTQDEYNKVKNNPFRGLNDRNALRLDLSDGVVEIVCKYIVDSYYIRYFRKPKPIVLVDLPDNITIDGESKVSECELHEALHQRILDRAVMDALQSKSITDNNNNAHRQP